MLKSVLMLAVVSPIHSFISKMDIYISNTVENGHVQSITEQVENFYRRSSFIPAPRVIDLSDINCVKRVVNDLTVFGRTEHELRDKLIKLL